MLWCFMLGVTLPDKYTEVHVICGLELRVYRSEDGLEGATEQLEDSRTLSGAGE